MTDRELMTLAEEARRNAYAPYSGFAVGAALLSRDGRVFCGCNVENISFSLTNCAERSALFAAVSAGVREFDTIAITGAKLGEEPDHCAPCGACRQVLAEFCGEDFRVLLGNSRAITVHRMGELLPLSFSADIGETT